jgi:hypothetical protein
MSRQDERQLSMEPSKGLNLSGGMGRRRGRRRIVRRALIVLAVLLGAGVGIGLWAARALPRIAAAQISRLTNTRVQMGAFDFHRDGSVSIDGLVIRPEQGRPSDDDAILRARSVRVRFNRRSLLRLAPRVTEIRLEDFIFDVQLDWDAGRWNVGDLRTARSPEGANWILPTVVLQGGVLRYSKASGGKIETICSIPIEARFGLSEQPERGYDFQVKTAKLSGGYGESHLEGYWRTGELALAGGLSSTDIPSLERAWAADVIAAQLKYAGNGDYTLNLRIRDAHAKHSPEVDALRMLGPAALEGSGLLATLQSFFGRYRPCGIVGKVTLDARGNLHRLNDSEITGSVVCTDVSACDRHFPYAIDHLAGRLDFTQSTLVIHHLAGKHGGVDLDIDGWTKGSGEDHRYQYCVRSDNMVLDEALYAALQPEQKRLWDAFKPTGVVGIDYRMSRDSTTEKRRYVNVTLQQVSAAYEKFPYPLENLTGGLYFDSDMIVASDLVSQVGDRRIRVGGKVTRTPRRTGGPGEAQDADRMMYSIDVDGNDVPLDAVLAKSMPQQYRKFYERFDVNGTADVRAHIFTTGEANEVGPVSFFAEVSTAMGSLKPRELPVALSNVSADLSITPESVSIRQLAGQYGHSPVSLTGAVCLAREDRPQQVQLKIAAQDVPLDGRILEMLPSPLKQRVAAFDPQGNVNLAVDLVKVDVNKPADYSVSVECLGDRIKHERFAYPLHEVRGTILIRPDQVTFAGIEAAPAVVGAKGWNSAIRIDGYLDLTNDAPGLGSFTITARDLPFTEELGSALSGGFLGIYRDLSPNGPFDLHLEIPTILRTANDETCVRFKGRADFKTCNLTVSGEATELCGGLGFEGDYNTKTGISGGYMTLDAQKLTVKGRSITDLKAGIVFDPNTRVWVADDFVGDCCGGRVLGHFALRRVDDAALQYRLQVAFHRVDLQQFLAAGKAAPSEENDYSSGTMNASLSVGARIGDAASRRGACKIDIVDMRVGKVSPLANIVSVLQLNEPTDYTFDRMLIDSYLKRDTLVIQKFDMSGKNAAFAGAGTMDVSTGQVNLTLTARGRRVATAQPSVFESLAEGLGGAVVRVEVTGEAGNPSVTTKTLPLIEDSLKILGTPR